MYSRDGSVRCICYLSVWCDCQLRWTDRRTDDARNETDEKGITSVINVDDMRRVRVPDGSGMSSMRYTTQIIGCPHWKFFKLQCNMVQSKVFWAFKPWTHFALWVTHCRLCVSTGRGVARHLLGGGGKTVSGRRKPSSRDPVGEAPISWRHILHG